MNKEEFYQEFMNAYVSGNVSFIPQLVAIFSDLPHNEKMKYWNHLTCDVRTNLPNYDSEFVPWVKFIHSHLVEIILETIRKNGIPAYD